VTLKSTKVLGIYKSHGEAKENILKNKIKILKLLVLLLQTPGAKV